LDKAWSKRITQIFSAGAVALSLVFVGLEVRETARQTQLNTEALQMAAYQDLIGQIEQFNIAMLEPSSAAVYMKLTDPNGTWDALTPLEQNQGERILFLLTRHADMAYYQYEQGLLPKDRLDSAVRPLVGGFVAPLYRDFWERRKANFVPAFQDYIDSQIAGL
jgi:hypothetical protein